MSRFLNSRYQSLEVYTPGEQPQDQVYTKLMFPAALPSMFVGLKLAAPSAFCAVIFTELLRTQGGLGYGIFASQYASRWDLCWGYIFMAILAGVLIFYLVELVRHFVIRWKSTD